MTRAEVMAYRRKLPKTSNVLWLDASEGTPIFNMGNRYLYSMLTQSLKKLNQNSYG